MNTIMQRHKQLKAEVAELRHMLKIAEQSANYHQEQSVRYINAINTLYIKLRQKDENNG